MAKRDMRDLAEDIEIQANHLDVQWAVQPRLMRQACVKLAAARAEARAAKDKVKAEFARIKLLIRQAPERFGHSGTRAPSNDVVEEIATTQPEYQRAQAAHNQAEYEAEILEADVTALSHRKVALENSVILYCRDYGAECKLPTQHVGAAREKLSKVTEGDRWRGATKEINPDE